MEITAVTLSALWGIFVPRQKTYQIKAGENCVNKDHCVTMQIYIEPLWGEKRKFGLCRRSKIWVPAAKFDEFCKRKFDKRGILFCAVFVFYLYVNYSAELDVHLNCGSLRDFTGTLAFEIRATLHCGKTNNYKFITMFHLQILYFMLELAIGIFLLDKGDSWIYLTCCGALIDFFLCVLLCFIPYSLIEVCFFEGSVRFCMINYEICNKIYRLTSHLT